MNKLSTIFAFLAAIAVFSENLLAESDVFSVNFYHYGQGGILTTEEQARLRVESDEAAGMGDWNTTAWENFPASTGTQNITSSAGSSAKFNVIRTRNASPFYWAKPRETLFNNPNADLMDSGFSATEDGGNLFEMTVSDIPLNNYDVILYIRINNSQYSPGTGNIVFNGGPVKSFTFPGNSEFSAFDEITGTDTTGNYILFEGVTGSSFSLQMRGDGFCHMGPAGFQFGVTTPNLYPHPQDGTAVSAVTTTQLLWTLPDPKGAGPITCDVYFGTDAGMSASNPEIINNPQVVFGDSTKNGSYDIDLDSNQEYYWQVVIYDAGVPIAQPIFTFNTFNAAPTVNAGDDQTVWMTGDSVQVDLAGLVDDDGIPLPYSVFWEVIDEPLEGAASIDPVTADTENILVTFNEIGVYQLQLTAFDGELADSNRVTITVNADLNPQPADDSTVSALTTTRIYWTLPEPSYGCEVTCDVYFGTNANMSLNPQVVFRDGTKNGSHGVNLVSNQQYYWQVVVYDSGIEGGTEPIAQPIFTFNTNNTTPIVYAGEDITTWMTADGTAQTEVYGSVADDGLPEPYSVFWEVISKPVGSSVTTDPVAADTETIRVTFSEEGQYVLRLTADDGETSDFDTVTITVNSNACKVYGNLCLQFLLGDLNRDGKIDLSDLGLFAQQWLDPAGCTGHSNDCADLIGDDGVGLKDFSALAQNWQNSRIPLVISEFMASSSSKSDDPEWQLDEDGDSSDWIEIYNPTNMSVNLNQWSLTDKSNNLTKWQFPDITLNAGAYLLVFASEKDRTDPAGQLHTNFSLSADGGYLGLVMPDGETVVSEFASDYPKQVNNISYGLASEGDNRNLHYRYFDNPSPRGESVGDGFAGVVGDTSFSVDRGFYQEEFDVEMTCRTGGANIRYTVDCSEPTLTNGIDYNPNVPIHIDRTTCLRARAFKTDCLPSNIDTQTYIYLADVISQPTNPPGFPSKWDAGKAADYDMDPAVISRYTEDEIKSSLLSLPSVSLVTDMDNLFDNSIGIYIHPTMEGIDWERPVSAEWIDPNGGPQFQINCGLRMQGNAARWYAIKKPFRLLFKGIYGSSKLEFPMFAESGNAADSFDTITLRANSQNNLGYGGKTQITDENGRRTLMDMGTRQSHGRFVHLYVNGLYWGIYNAVERPQASFCVNYFGGTKDQWDANNGNTAIDGTRDTFNEMIAHIHAVPFDNTAYQKIQGNNPDGSRNPDFPVYLDMPNYIDYMLSNFYLGTGDWAGNASQGTRNYYCGRRRTENDDPGFKWFIWDAEMSLGGGNNTGVSYGPAEPYSVLKYNEQFKLLFADHVHRHMFNGGALTPEASLARFNAIADDTRPAIIAEEARWDLTTVGTWESIISTITSNFIPSRTNTVVDQFRAIGLYPYIDAPIFSQHGGAVESGFDLEMTSPAGTIYYTLDGSDPHIWADTDPEEPVSVTLVTEAAAKSVLVPTGDIGTDWQGGSEPYNETGWDDGTPITTGRTGGVGYDENPTYDPYITYDVISEMNNKNTSCYIRIPFNVSAEDLGDLNFMTLRMRYDDGFVAYINGTKVAQSTSAPASPQWNSRSNGGQSDSLAVEFADFFINQHIDELRVGANILAIHGLNAETTSSDFLISAELIAGHNAWGGGEISPSAIEYNGTVRLDSSTTIKARAFSSGNWSALNEATFAVGPVLENLRITEIMYHPTDPTQAEKDDAGNPNLTDDDFEFIELKNIGVEAINLNLVSFTDGIDFTFGDYTLNPGEFTVVVSNQAAFMARYPGVSSTLIAGTYAGTFSNSGEEIVVRDAHDTKIHDFDFNDGWFVITDGGGYSLNKLDPDNAATAAPDSWDSQSGWRPSSILNGTPGANDTGYTLQPDDIVISEVMIHTDDLVYGDWIEIWNRTESPVYIGGWFLSDSEDNLMKYEIAADDQRATINPNSYVVFDSINDFNNPGDGGCHVQFALSEYGEDVYLSSGSGGVITNYATEQEDFGAAENGTSVGMYIKSDLSDDFVRLQTVTKGYANNNDPIIGPVVISEIMYNPADPDSEAEFIELKNITGSEVKLYDPANPANTWQIKGIGFTFPQGVKIPGNQRILVTRGDPVQFRSTYGIGAGIDIYRYVGSLDNSGEKITLIQPGAPDPITAEVPEIRIDRVNYDDSWYPETDGQGKSLTRRKPGDYGNDAANWQAATPSPGS